MQILDGVTKPIIASYGFGGHGRVKLSNLVIEPPEAAGGEEINKADSNQLPAAQNVVAGDFAAAPASNGGGGGGMMGGGGGDPFASLGGGNKPQQQAPSQSNINDAFAGEPLILISFHLVRPLIRSPHSPPSVHFLLSDNLVARPTDPNDQSTHLTSQIASQIASTTC